LVPAEVTPRRVDSPAATRTRSFDIRPGEWLAKALLGTALAPLLLAAAFIIAAVTTISEAIPQARLFTLMRIGVTTEWSHVIMYGGLIGMLAGAIYWYLAPWFLRLRLRWCGANGELETRDLRIIYFASVLPAAAWFVLGMMSLLNAFTTPEASMMKFDHWFEVTVPVVGMLLLAAGCVVTFLIAWQAFGASMIRAAVWLVAVPVFWYSILIAGLLATAGSGVSEEARRKVMSKLRAGPDIELVADLAREKSYTGSATTPYSFRYPANWTVKPVAVGDANTAALAVESGGDSGVVFAILPQGSVGDQELLGRIRGNASGLPGGLSITPGTDTPINSLGGFPGQGEVHDGMYRGESSKLTIFLHRLASGQRLLIVARRPNPDRHSTQSGIDLVLDSLRIGTE